MLYLLHTAPILMNEGYILNDYTTFLIMIQQKIRIFGRKSRNFSSFPVFSCFSAGWSVVFLAHSRRLWYNDLLTDQTAA